MAKIAVIELKKDKGQPIIMQFPSVAKLARCCDKAEIGIAQQALWNALNKGNGKFENKKCKVYYKEVSLTPQDWR